MSMRISSDLMREIEEYKRDVEKDLDDTKQGLTEVARDFAHEVRELNIPVGPPHNKAYQIGNLKESMTLEITDDETEWSAEINIGGPTAPYVGYVAARDGVNLWDGATETEEQMGSIMDGGIS